MAYRKKVDSNQADLVKKMRAIGMSVYVTSRVGGDFVDVVAGHAGVNYLFEIKDPRRFQSERKLRPGQQKFFDSWRGAVHKVETIDDVIKIINNQK